MSRVKRMIVRRIAWILAIIALVAVASVYVVQTKPQASWLSDIVNVGTFGLTGGSSGGCGLLTGGSCTPSPAQSSAASSAATISSPIGSDIVFAIDNSTDSSAVTIVGSSPERSGVPDQTYSAYVRDFLFRVPDYLGTNDRISMVTFGEQANISQPTLTYEEAPSHFGNLSNGIPTIKATNPDFYYGIKTATDYANANTRVDSNGAVIPKVIVLITVGTLAENYSTPSLAAVEDIINKGSQDNVTYITMPLNGYFTNLHDDNLKLFGSLANEYERPNGEYGIPSSNDATYWVSFLEHYISDGGTASNLVVPAALLGYIHDRQTICLQIIPHASSTNVSAGQEFSITYDYISRIPTTPWGSDPPIQHIKNASINVTLPVGVEYVSASGATVSGTPSATSNADGTTALTINIGDLTTGTAGSVVVQVRALQNIYAD